MSHSSSGLVAAMELVHGGVAGFGGTGAVVPCSVPGTGAVSKRRVSTTFDPWIPSSFPHRKLRSFRLSEFLMHSSGTNPGELRRFSSRGWNASRRGVLVRSSLAEDLSDSKGSEREGNLVSKPAAENGIPRVASASGNAAGDPNPIGTFRAQLKRAEVQIPAFAIRLNCSDLEEEELASSRKSLLDSAIASGLTIVVLEGSLEDVGGATLFETACTLKALIRGRAQLLIAERADIAAAAGADGVLLSEKGLPAVVARRMMENVMQSDSTFLPLVGKIVKDFSSAIFATVTEGADFILLQQPSSDQDVTINQFTESVRNQVNIPILSEISQSGELSEQYANSTFISEGVNVVKSGSSGIILDLHDLEAVLKSTNVEVKTYVSEYLSSLNRALSGESVDEDVPWSDRDESDEGKVLEKETVAFIEEDSKTLLENKAREIRIEEKILLSSLLELLQEACPQMAEISLLEDSIARLDDLFLLVIVGEFNSGKSSVINALLGDRFLKEGVLPTTNEITLLRHSDETKKDKSNEKDVGFERHPDGHLLKYISADLLKQINIVDTPGTNVILERQQRLTEEFVPKADLVFFVLSADRPLSESEVSFLRYIKQWGKKIVFLLNKSDLLESDEVKEIIRFVEDNVQKLLGVDVANCFSVSAKNALSAKLNSKEKNSDDTSESSNGVFSLQGNPLWEKSGFENLENFITRFLRGSTDLGAERLRLKLSTPLGVASALLISSEKKLEKDAELVKNDEIFFQDLLQDMEEYKKEMIQEAKEQTQKITSLVEEVANRAEKFVDETLQISNVNTFSQYLLNFDITQSNGLLPVSKNFSTRIISSAFTDVQKSLFEYQAWINSNNSRQIYTILESAKSNWREIPVTTDEKQIEEGIFALDAYGEKSSSFKVLEEFDMNAAELVLEAQFREVVASTFAGFGAAGVSASVLTTVLPNTVEDLIALSVCTAGGYTGILNLPSRRDEVKKRIIRVANSFNRKMEEAMEEELQVSLQQAQALSDTILAPYKNSIEERATRVANLQSSLQNLSSQLRSLRQRVLNLGS